MVIFFSLLFGADIHAEEFPAECRKVLDYFLSWIFVGRYDQGDDLYSFIVYDCKNKTYEFEYRVNYKGNISLSFETWICPKCHQFFAGSYYQQYGPPCSRWSISRIVGGTPPSHVMQSNCFYTVGDFNSCQEFVDWCKKGYYWKVTPVLKEEVAAQAQTSKTLVSDKPQGNTQANSKPQQQGSNQASSKPQQQNSSQSNSKPQQQSNSQASSKPQQQQSQQQANSSKQNTPNYITVPVSTLAARAYNYTGKYVTFTLKLTDINNARQDWCIVFDLKKDWCTFIVCGSTSGLTLVRHSTITENTWRDFWNDKQDRFATVTVWAYVQDENNICVMGAQ